MHGTHLNERGNYFLWGGYCIRRYSVCGILSSFRQIKNSFAVGSPAASHFFLLRQEKVTKKKATPAHRPFGVPCVAQPDRPPHKLARSASRPRAQTYSSDCPCLVSATRRRTGEKKANSKTSPPTRRWAQSAHLLTNKKRGLVPTQNRL